MLLYITISEKIIIISSELFNNLAIFKEIKYLISFDGTRIELEFFNNFFETSSSPVEAENV